MGRNYSSRRRSGFGKRDESGVIVDQRRGYVLAAVEMRMVQCEAKEHKGYTQPEQSKK